MSAPNQKKKIPGTKPNYLYSILGVTMVLVLSGFFGLLMIQAAEVVRFMKEQVEIVVEIKSEQSEAERKKLLQSIEHQDFVKIGSVKFLSKEEGAKMLQKEFGDDFLKLDMPNPLYDAVTFNIKAEALEEKNIEDLTEPLRSESAVRDLYYQENLAGLIADNLKDIGYIVLLIGFFLLLIAVFLIHNTIRLALYANRFLIKNMELVGASWDFISRPYILKSALHGFISGVLAIAILLGALFLVRMELPEIEQVTNYQYIGIMMVFLPLLGIAISTGSTFYVVNKYLRMRVDDLY